MKLYNGIRRGDIYFCQLDKRRPCIIVSNNMMNATSMHFIVVPLSSNLKRLDLPSHVLMRTKVQDTESMAMTEHVQQVDYNNIVSPLVGIASNLDMVNIDRALISTLALGDM